MRLVDSARHSHSVDAGPVANRPVELARSVYRTNDRRAAAASFVDRYRWTDIWSDPAVHTIHTA